MINKTKIFEELISDIKKEYTLLANTSAFIYENFDNLNWAGFYRAENKILYLDAFQGKVACTEISFNRGVCGHAAINQKTIIVDDVHEFADHIACDSASESEIVIPLFVKNKLWGVLDIDSPIKKRFDMETKNELEAIAKILENKLNQLKI
ncbi:GAF domain-containing protein [Mycoplasma sp. 744]|uniref:GAF domain-containing protein n=1 Tax=Mycoplasma sp. 744 TaxID=3108531 RepID=UPI002B1CEF34|nr:GAF domain-containing protein [Mycoplasma sp. 744]MEA4115557.1 GAF domain-containing protein [Mycoplasma sp. 744]